MTGGILKHWWHWQKRLLTLTDWQKVQQYWPSDCVQKNWSSDVCKTVLANEAIDRSIDIIIWYWTVAYYSYYCALLVLCMITFGTLTIIENSIDTKWYYNNYYWWQLWCVVMIWWWRNRIDCWWWCSEADDDDEVMEVTLYAVSIDDKTLVWKMMMMTMIWRDVIGIMMTVMTVEAWLLCWWHAADDSIDTSNCWEAEEWYGGGHSAIKR